jgi:gamma-glutamyl:cysteine ligase YbdK (ATP-grasp superfamily)
VRLQPALGTIEVRITDAHTRMRDTAPLVALVQCLTRLAALGDEPPAGAEDTPEVIDENRFLASRDGMAAKLLEPALGDRRPVRERLEAMVEACGPHAAQLGCSAELEGVAALADAPGAERQRAIARGSRGEHRGRPAARAHGRTPGRVRHRAGRPAGLRRPQGGGGSARSSATVTPRALASRSHSSQGSSTASRGSR